MTRKRTGRAFQRANASALRAAGFVVDATVKTTVQLKPHLQERIETLRRAACGDLARVVATLCDAALAGDRAAVEMACQIEEVLWRAPDGRALLRSAVPADD